jgi:hypothetical protein
MAVQQGSIRFGLAAEATEGTAKAAPAFVFGLETGGVIVELNQEPDDLTSGARSTSTVFRGDASVGAEFTGRAQLESVGHLAYAVLGDVATTGEATPYTHVFTLADTLPSYTLFQGIVDGAGYDIPRVNGAKCDSLTFEWEGNQPLKVTASYAGRALSFGASFTASVTDETGLTTNFRPAGGTFELDVDSGTPATACLKGGSITLTNNLERQFCSGTLTAGSVDAGWHVAECAFTTVPTNIDQWREIVTGSAAGAAISPTPVYGSFEVLFKTPASAGYSLEIEGLRVGFQCELPTAEAGAGAAEVELAGVCLNDGTSPVTITLKNATTSYE